MINENLHKKPVALDRVKHKDLKLDLNHRDLGTVGKLNAFFVAGTEFGDACREYPVVWVHAGTDDAGKQLVAPIAVFGLKAEQNLCIDNDKWRVRYVPAALRLYPFGLARVAPEQMVVCFDETWGGFGSQGETLFNADGTPTEFIANVQKQLENFELEVERTRVMGTLLVEKGLLRDMRFDATLPDGSKLTVDGFLTVDEAKLDALPDAQVLELHRSGLLGLVHAHFVSLGGMRRLLDWHLERLPRPAPAA